MRAIYNKELRSYFTTTIGYLYCGSLFLIVGMYFVTMNLKVGYAKFEYVLSALKYLYIVLIPILTMRVFAEEKKQKTDQLLFTSPVSIEKIVLGKYAAVSSVYLITVAVLLCYPLIMGRYGTIDYGTTYTSFVGFVCIGLFYLALGLLLSSVTENQIIALILTVVAILISLTIGRGMDNFTYGILSINDVVYYVSGIMLCLMVTGVVLKKTRIPKKTIFYGLLLIVLNGLLTLQDISFDFSSQGMYTLTTSTVEMAKNLEEEIVLYYVTTEENEVAMMKKIVEKYPALSANITLQYKDTKEDATFLAAFETDGDSIEDNSVIIVNERTKIWKYIAYTDMVEFDYMSYYYGQTQTPEVISIDVEGKITSAIINLFSEEQFNLYQVLGHGETELPQYLINEFEKLSIEVNDLELTTQSKIPEDCHILLINGPLTDISEEEKKQIIEYLEAGGNAILSIDYSSDDMTNYYEVLENYGITVIQGMIEESSSYSPSEYPYYTYSILKENELNRGISQQSNPVLVAFAMGLEVENIRETLRIDSFLVTSEEAVCIMENGESITGPFDIAVLVQEEGTQDTTKLIVLASNYISDESLVSYNTYGNTTLYNNMVAYLTGQETGLSIAVKSLEETYLATTDTQVMIWTILLVVVFPIVWIVVGFIVWAVRRSR